MKISPNTRWLTAGLTLLAPISWGTTYITITEFLPNGRPLLVASARVVPAGLVLVAVGMSTSRWRPQGKEWRQTATLALFNFGIFFPLLIVAIYRLPGGVAAAVGGLQPLLVAVLWLLLSGHRPRRVDLLVGGVAAVGVGLVVLRPDANFDPVGVIAAVGANISFSIGVVLTKRFPTPPNRLAATGWQLLMSSLILIPIAVVVEGAPPPLTISNLAGFTYLSLAATGVAFVLWFNGVRRLPVAAPPLLGLGAPITGAALGWIVLNESLTPLQITGFVVTIGAILYGATLRPPPELADKSLGGQLGEATPRRRIRPALLSGKLAPTPRQPNDSTDLGGRIK